ncbi:MBL fold metallo-hydrolase [Mesorhizobium waimense]|uniref:MBL fold metallo-hydrolase n=1 Tax=Mesorhizobium waimense TaxID=1300307 RepID=A0A3A5JSS6_9HYPH|nr:MBL fold metallo-hydrolase [Mesorhizobium waimense]RJT23274.1 MBL fold metallo-hydrolase [Mesorhizobium waimense]
MNLIQHSENLFEFRDTCNVFVLKSGDECILIDTGSGSVLDHLHCIGVERVAWVLHTHHHRDQCWGTHLVRKGGASVAVPEFERHLFEDVEAHWQTRGIFDNYTNANTFFSLAQNVPVDAVLEDYTTFAWKDYKFYVLPAKGHTYGMITLIAEVDGLKVAFTGDLMTCGGKLYQLHAMEYAYADMVGVEFTMQSILALKKERVVISYPSHGEVIRHVDEDIANLESRLAELANIGRLLTSGWNTGYPDWKTIHESSLQRISEHLLWAGPYTCSNFYIVLSGNGHALLIDYGAASQGQIHFGLDHEGIQALRFVEHHIDQMRDEFGVQHIEVVVATHIHDDHICGIPYLQRKFGTQCWALDCVAEVISNPAAWASTPCCFNKPIGVAKVLRDGERFHWRGHDFVIYYAPGQTEFHSMILGTIDGKRMLFSGDNVALCNPQAGQIDADIPVQLTVMRNSFQLEMHRHCAKVMETISPDFLCPGHGNLIPMDHSRIAQYSEYIKRKEMAFHEVVGKPADHFIDLFWARMLPYVAAVCPGGEITYTIKIRNNLERVAVYGARLLPASGWVCRDDTQSVALGPSERGEVVFTAFAPGDVDPQRKLMTAEILIDGLSQGPICEALISTTGNAQQPRQPSSKNGRYKCLHDYDPQQVHLRGYDTGLTTASAADHSVRGSNH